MILLYYNVFILNSSNGESISVTSTTPQELLTLIKPVSESNNSVGLGAARAARAALP